MQWWNLTLDLYSGFIPAALSSRSTKIGRSSGPVAAPERLEHGADRHRLRALERAMVKSKMKP